jgi:hypothetical protein
VLLGYAVGAGEHVSILGWVVVFAFPLLGAMLLHRVWTWNAPLHCRLAAVPGARLRSRSPREILAE